MDIGFPTAPGTTARTSAATETTYLITGGAGFIGSHLAEALLEPRRPCDRTGRSFDRLHEEPSGDGRSSRTPHGDRLDPR